MPLPAIDYGTAALPEAHCAILPPRLFSSEADVCCPHQRWPGRTCRRKRHVRLPPRDALARCSTALLVAPCVNSPTCRLHPGSSRPVRLIGAKMYRKRKVSWTVEYAGMRRRTRHGFGRGQ